MSAGESAATAIGAMHAGGMGRGQGTAQSIAQSKPRVKREKGYRGRQRYWTDERITAELRAFLAPRLATGDAAWPTRGEFEAAGQYHLWRTMRQYGGSLHWARRLGFAVRSQQIRSMPSDAELLHQAKDVIADSGRLPGPEALRRKGYPKLATAVTRAGGAVRFAELQGLPNPRQVTER